MLLGCDDNGMALVVVGKLIEPRVERVRPCSMLASSGQDRTLDAASA